jgi:hypothetical protein
MTPNIGSYLAFVPAHTPSRHRVLAIVDRGDGAEADAVATFPDAPSATVLATGIRFPLAGSFPCPLRSVWPHHSMPYKRNGAPAASFEVHRSTWLTSQRC